MKISSSFFSKLFSSVLPFLIAFAALSVTIDVYYLSRNTCAEPGMDGWTGLSDFKVYWVAGRNMEKRLAPGADEDLNGRYPVYDRNEKFFHFRYAPLAAILFVPFGKFDHPAAALLLWSLLSNLFFLAALVLLARRVQLDFKINDTAKNVILWGAAVGTLKYYFMDVAQGQTNTLVALLFVLFLISYIKDRDIACGAVFAAILQMKLMFLPMLLYFLLRRRFKLILSTAVTFAALLALPACWLGAHGALEMTKEWTGILTMSVPSQLLDYKNQSFVYAIVVQLFKIPAVQGAFSAGQLVYPMSAFFTLLVYAAALWIRRSTKRVGEARLKYIEISMLIFAALFFSPLSWGAYYLMLIIPLSITILFTMKSARKAPLYFALGAYFFLTSMYGTDITDWIPVVNTWHFIHLSLGTLFLFFAMLYSCFAPAAEPLPEGERT